MPLFGTNTCKCPAMKNALAQPNPVFLWDTKKKEYYLDHATSGRARIAYCPFCGGMMPKTRRSKAA